MRFGNTIADQKVLISAITMGSIKAIAIQIGFDFMCNNNGFHGTLISSKNFN